MNHSVSTLWKQVLIITAILSVSIPYSGFAQEHRELSVISDPLNPLKNTLRQQIIGVINAINSRNTWRGITLAGKHPGIGLLNRLIDEQNIISIQSSGHLYLLHRPDGTVEVRNLYVKTTRTDTLRYKELALHFNDKAQLIDANLAPDIQNSQLILDRKLFASEEEQRRVEQVIHLFQNGITQRNTSVVKRLLASDAYIVNGSISRYTDDGDLYFWYLTMTGENYIQRLEEKTFHAEYVDIDYQDVEVFRHPLIDEVYGALFYQTWNTPTYSDTGYVTMVIDLREKPKIHVKAWQEYRPATGRLQPMIKPVAGLAVRRMTEPYKATPVLAPVEFPSQKEEGNKSFLETHKKWLMISAATTAITIGTALLTGDKESDELPGPPGRPAMN